MTTNNVTNLSVIPTKYVKNIRRGSLQGFMDPIGLSMMPRDLIGNQTNPGIYYRMRIHPIIYAVMEARKNFLRSIEFLFSGKHADKLNRYWQRYVKTTKNVPYDLSSFIADVSDNKSSYGFQLYEYHKSNQFIYLYPVDHLQVISFEGTDQLEGVLCYSGTATKQLPADEICLYSNMFTQGNWWGLSDLRPLVETFLVYESEMKNFLASRPIEKGVVYAKQVEISDANSYVGIEDMLNSIIKGQSVTGILDPGFELGILQVNNGQDSVVQLEQIIQLTNEVIRNCLWSNLESLGISTHGSRALGETFELSDQKKLEQYIEAELEELKMSKLFYDIAYELDIPVSEIEISTPGLVKSDDRAKYDEIIQLIKDGIITKEEIGPENWKRILESKGIVLEEVKSNISVLEGDVTMSNEEVAQVYVVPQDVIKSVNKGFKMASKMKEDLSDVDHLSVLRAMVVSGVITKENWEVVSDWVEDHLELEELENPNLPEFMGSCTNKEYAMSIVHGGKTGFEFFKKSK